MVARSFANIALYAWFISFSGLLAVVCLIVAWSHGATHKYVLMASAAFVAGGLAAALSGVSAVRIFHRFPKAFRAN
jgi:uncharacterized membrane protein